MGKINATIGKRSQKVTGEVMVEVASGNQQLRTQYSQPRTRYRRRRRSSTVPAADPVIQLRAGAYNGRAHARP